MAERIRERNKTKEVIIFEDAFTTEEHNSHIAACSNDACLRECGRKTIQNIDTWFGCWVTFKPQSVTECYHHIPIYNPNDNALPRIIEVDKYLQGNLNAKLIKVEEVIAKPIAPIKPRIKSQFDDYL